MRNTSYERRATSLGFTLVELLIALVVTSVVLTAVATLAFALSSANDSVDDTSYKQAQVRIATLRISDLIRHSKLICSTPGNDLAVWTDDKNQDGQININELVCIERGDDTAYLRLCEFPSSDISVVELSEIETLTTSGYDVTYIPLIPQCSNVEFLVDAEPPMTKFVSISFNLAENDIIHQYQINATLRSWAGNLLSEDGDDIVSDDD
jgi:prepilin-type N-terminal cleavage/methylation domain-containing protein